MDKVTITNITDHPDSQSLLIDIYNGVLLPGESASIKAEQMNDKIQGLAEAGYIAIGDLPSYYIEWKYPPRFTVEIIEEPTVEETVVEPTPVVSKPTKPGKK